MTARRGEPAPRRRSVERFLLGRMIANRRLGLMAAMPPGSGSSSAGSIPRGLRVHHRDWRRNLSGYI